MRKSTLNIVGDIIDETLGLIGDKRFGKAPHYQHDESCLMLSREPVTDFCAKALINDIYEKVKSNLHTDSNRSKENWRWKPNPAKTDESKAVNRAKRLEVKLERMIIETLKDWVNQVPTASGVMVKRSGNSGSIDLVHRCGGGLYEFIELKVTTKTNNPLYAAMEILQYGILYMLARQAMNAGEEKELLQAKAIQLKVLAPTTYYERFELDWLESAIKDGLKRFLKEKECGFLMDFNFEAFPENFNLSPFPTVEAIKEALDDRRSVYP